MTADADVLGGEAGTRKGAQPPGRGRLLLVASRSGRVLARALAELLDCRAPPAVHGESLHLADVDFEFGDGETGVRLSADPGGSDAYIITSLVDPVSGRGVDRQYIALLAAARALREWGAAHVTAVLPYLAYARQDKPTRGRIEPTSARLMADLASTAGIERLITWHPHIGQMHGFYGVTPVDVLDAVPYFVKSFRRFAGRPEVIVVAPDQGAGSLISSVGQELGLATAFTLKHRPRIGEAEITDLVGDFGGKRIALILDDMISSGGTIDAVVRRLVDQEGIEEVHVAASHNLCTEAALRVLVDLHADRRLQEVLVTNSIPQSTTFLELPFLKVVDLSPAIGRAVASAHGGRPMGG